MANCLKGHYYDSTCFNSCPSCYPMASEIMPDATARHDLDWPAERAKLARREAWVRFMAAVMTRDVDVDEPFRVMSAVCDKALAEYDKRIAEGKL